MGVLGWRCSSRDGKDFSKEDEVKVMTGRGVKRSEEIVTGRAKSEVLDVKSRKAS